MNAWSLCLLVPVLVACRAPVHPARGPEAPSRRIGESNIEFFEARVARDPYGARDRAQLGALYLARARRDGGEADLQRAELLARESRQVRGRRNPDAIQVLAGTLMAQHRFTEAYALVATAASAAPEDAVARAILGEIALELGRYAEADSLFGSLTLRRYQTAIGPRYARWLDLNGRSAEARTLLEQVRARLAGGFRIPPEQLAWFDLRLGELAVRNGRPDLGEAAFRRGLDVVPDDAALLTALARLRGYRGEWAAAVELANRALAVRFDPASLALLAEAHAARGDTVRAAEYARAMTVAISGQAGGFHRGWLLFLLDHGGTPQELLRRAEAEHLARHDVYGHDLLSWALHRAGRSAEALPLSDSALSRGTRDPLLYYHAGVVALAAGDTTAGITRLTAALELEGTLRPDQARTARQLLRQARR